MTKPTEYSDLTIVELSKLMINMMSKGFICNAKFTCDNCGSRQTASEPNCLHVKNAEDNIEDMVGNYFCEECGEQVYPKKMGLMIMGGFKFSKEEK